MKNFLNILLATLLVVLFTPLSINAQCQNDVVAPIWTNCPSSITLPTDDGCQPYRWVAPTLSDNCPGRIDTLNTNTNYNGACIPSNTSINVVYLARDQAGNVGVCTFTVNVVPTACFGEEVPPNISNCPTDIITTSSNGQCSPVTWVAPTVTDNCDQIPILTSSSLNGSCFNIGTTNVVYTATDANRNTATCSFTVIVNAVKPFTDNLINNFDFESGMTSFTDLGNTATTSDAYSESTAVIVGKSLGGVSFTQNIIPGGIYTFSSFNKLSALLVSANVSMKFLDIDENVIANSETTAPIISLLYTLTTLSATAPANAVYIQLSVLKGGDKDFVTTDKWSLTVVPPAPAPFFGNLIPNFGFEAGMTGYDDLVNPTTTTTDVRSGARAAKIDNTSVGGFGFSRDVVPGTTYTFQAYSKVTSTSPATIGVKFYDASANVISNSDKKIKISSSVFTETNITMTAPLNAVYVRAYVSKTSSNGALITDDWSFKESLPVVAPTISTCAYDPNKCYKLVNVPSGKAIQVPLWSTADGTDLAQWAYLGQNNQKWKIVPTDNGFVKIINVYSGKALSNDETHSNATCFQYTYAANRESDWLVECQANGSVLFKHRLSGRYLDVKNGSASVKDGARVVIHAFDHTVSQKWRIIEVPCENYSYMVAVRNPQQNENQVKSELTTNTSGQGEIGSAKSNDGKAQTTTKIPNVSEADAVNPLFKQKTETGKAKAYPNPTSAVINLDISSYQDKTLDIQLLNMMGTQVKTKKVDANSGQNIEIDVNDLPSGTYLLIIKSIKANGSTDQIQRINVIR